MAFSESLFVTKIALLTVTLVYCAQSSHGQGLHFTLGGINLTNNSHILITDIGTDENALLCVTNNINCCSYVYYRAGEWFYPNRSSVPNNVAGHDFFRGRGSSVVRLSRRNNVESPTGQYRCDVPDRNDVTQILYINVGRRVSSVTLNSSHYNPIEPGATPTLTCTAVVDPLYYNLTSIPLSVSWSGPVYGTGEFNTTGVQKVSDTIYVSRAILNSQGTYYDSGVYTCATNEHVRATTTVLFQVPHRPNVYNTRHGQNMYLFSWTQPAADNTTSYELVSSYIGPCSYVQTMRYTITGETRSYNITDLQEYSNYSYTLRAVNTTGMGPPYEGMFTTPAIAPISAPQSLNATPFSTNITIQWNRISCLNQNSEITHYILRYGLTMSNQTTTTTVYGTNDNERVFTANRLEPLTMYTFEVAGVNRNGQISPYTTVSRSTTAPEVIAIQLHLYEVSNCLEWTERDTSSKLRDIISSTVAAVNDICPQCNVASSDLIEPFLVCFPQSVHQVTFRAQLKDRSQATAREIVTYIEEWITSSNGARLTAYGIRLNLNNTCVILLSTIDDPECPSYLGPQTTQQPYTKLTTSLESATLISHTSGRTTTKASQLSQNTQDTNAIVGGVVPVAIVLIIAIAVLIIVAIILLHRPRSKYTPKHPKLSKSIKLTDDSQSADNNQRGKTDETYQDIYDYCTDEHHMPGAYNITKCPVYVTGKKGSLRAPCSMNEGAIEETGRVNS